MPRLHVGWGGGGNRLVQAAQQKLAPLPNWQLAAEQFCFPCRLAQEEACEELRVSQQDFSHKAAELQKSQAQFEALVLLRKSTAQDYFLTPPLPHSLARSLPHRTL